MNNIKILIIAISILLLAPHPYTAEAKNLLTEGQALDILITQITKDKLYNDLSCLSFITTKHTTDIDEEYTEADWEFTIREKHDVNKCPGDIHTAPIVDSFRVNRTTGKIQWYDPINDKWLPYKAVKTNK